MRRWNLVIVWVTALGAVGGPVAAAASAFAARDRGAQALALRLSEPHLAALAARHGGAREDLHAERVEIDELGMAHVRVRQTRRGVPVWGGEAILHWNADGSHFATTDDLVGGLRLGDAGPGLAAEAAIEIAVQGSRHGAHLTAPPQADLWVLRHAGRDRLVYRVRLRREDGTADTALPVIFLDAATGESVFEYDNLQTGTGASLYSGNVTIATYYRSADKTWYLEDVKRRIGTFDGRNSTTSSVRFGDADDTWNAAAQRAAVDAHYGAAKTIDYYKNVQGRNGIDGQGGPGSRTSIDGVTRLLPSTVHYGSSYANAFWDGSSMTYGDGDGVTFGPLVSLDIAGHEMTHGVTEHSAGLTYAGEPGALNESMSDVFGAMVERYAKGESGATWKIGERCYTPANGTADALRYLDDPHKAEDGGFTGDDDPDHYSERYTGSADNGGVHINSGIANKAFYLLAKGGAHHRGGSMTGIGAAAAARIWYKALAGYMTSSTTFAGARTATLNAAAALYGSASTQHAATCEAWRLVGVGGACSGSGGTELVSNGGFEGSSSPWTLSGFLYTADGSYPHGGSGYAYAGNTNNTNAALYQQVAIPSSATGTLSLWLNVVSNETATTARDKLFVELRDTAGALVKTLGSFSNLNKGSSGAYAQKTFDVSAQKGRTLRVQFRVVTDGAYTTTFRVDDVSLK